MNIRKATLSDARDIAKVQVDSWRTTYKDIVPANYLSQMSVEEREKVWHDMLPNHDVFVAETTNGEIVGFASGGKERSGQYPPYEGELYVIYILEEHQREGLGKKLVKPIVQSLVRENIHYMIVMVLEQNPSKHFYESLGAKRIGKEEVSIGGKNVMELVYGWDDIRCMM